MIEPTEPPPAPSAGRVAFCVVPHVGGIYRVYQRLRRTLRPAGWDVLGVQVGDERNRWAVRPEMADDGCRAVAGDERDLQRAARRFVDWVVDQQIQVVMPMSSPAAVAAVPHLPPDVRVVNRCISITPHAYRIVTANLERVDRIVVASRRQEEDLRVRYPATATRLALIPNAVELERFSTAERYARKGPVRLAFVGRLIDREKGPLLLADVLRHLRAAQVEYRLNVAGSGKDERRVRESLRSEIAAGRVRMLGECTGEEIAQLLAATDILLLPSKHEGFPNVLLEAMAAGAVPIASRIAGVTDWIVRDGATGFLCPIGGAAAMAERIALLARDAALWQRMSHEAQAEVARRFSAAPVARGWDALFREVTALPERAAGPRPWSEFAACEAFTRRSRFRWVPAAWRHRVRDSLERLRARRVPR